jgi:hypothetical protein
MNWYCRFATVLVMVLLLGVAVPVIAQERGSIERSGKSYVEEILKTLEVEAGGTLLVETPMGAIEVETWSKDKVEVRIRKKYRGSSEDKAEEAFDNIEVFIKKRGDNVDILVEADSRCHLEKTILAFEIFVPERYNVDLETRGGSIKIDVLEGQVLAETAGGSIRVGVVEGDVEVHTAGGSIVVGPAAGDIDAYTSGGSIKLKESGGAVTAGTSGGSIRVDGTNGPVEVNTSGGSIQIDNAHGYIEAKTAGGSIEAQMVVSERNLDTHCTLVSSGGDLVLWIPADLAASFDVELKITRWADEDYEILSDFPLSIDKSGRGVMCSGDINGGGDPIRLKTTNGDIEIRKLR